jgi:hypothetical protein
MTFEQYKAGFDEILNNANPTAPYDDPHFLDYTKMNSKRINRWLKQGVVLPEMVDYLTNLKEKQKWVLITEHWCGDAAHIVPFLHLMSEITPMIELEIQLRDTDSEINSYLTNGSKSVPVLIVRDENNEDLFVWGPRPVACQDVFDEQKAAGATMEDLKVELQNWYNHDKGNLTQVEILERLKKN